MSVTSADHHVQAIIDLLENAGDGDWNTSMPPNVLRYWDRAQGERDPGAGQPPILYVWSPTGSSLERFSVDGDKFQQEDSTEVQAWSLDEGEAKQLQSDVTRILSQYLDDNKTETPYSDVAPVSEEDFREQNPARKTKAYVMSVEVETTGLSETGK